MKRFLITVAVIVSTILFLIYVNMPARHVSGMIYIPDAGVCTEIEMTTNHSDCGCCGVLWNGGVVHVSSDFHRVQIYHMAYLIATDGTKMVLECIEVSPCIYIGNYVISLFGFEQPAGDLLVINKGMLYRFTCL